MAARALTVMFVMLAAAPARAWMVAPAVSLEELAKSADLVCKATVVADDPVVDAWFEPVAGFEVRETQLRVISILKGTGVKLVRFRHYAPAPAPAVIGVYEPQIYRFTIGRSYLVFAAKAEGDVYRTLSKRSSSKSDAGVVLAADAKPHRGKTITAAALAELSARLASTTPDDVVEAIGQLDQLSGGHSSGLKDFDRAAVLDAIRPSILSKQLAVATAAIAVFGAESPYYDDQMAQFWLAGMGKGTVPGIGALTPSDHPAANVAINQLLEVARGSANAELRGLAIRALGRSRAIATAMLEAWSRDPEVAVRRAAVLVSAELSDHAIVQTAQADRAVEVRIAAALAAGFTQDPAVLPVLDKLVKDPAAKVREAAALSLLSFAPDQAAAVLKANLTSDYRSLFINALARHDAAPYLALLAEVIEKQLSPKDWSGGRIPSFDAWTILFDYVKARPPAEVTSGKLDRSLDALERMKWSYGNDARGLYALELRRGLPARAKRFRAAMRKAVSYNIDSEFDDADRNPAAYAP